MKTLFTVLVLNTVLFFALGVIAQTESATLSGHVTDPSGAAMSSVEVQVQNVLTGSEVKTRSNVSGLYVVTALRPGNYRIIVTNPGFRQIVKPNVVLNVQDNISINFSLQIGSPSETVTVEGGGAIDQYARRLCGHSC